MGKLFGKKMPLKKTLYLVDPADGFVKGWHVNRFLGYEPQVRMWLSQMKILNLNATSQVERFFEGLHLNREDHGWSLDATIQQVFWGGQYLFVRENKQISVIFGQYQDIRDRCDRMWPHVGLDEEILVRVSQGAVRQGMFLVGLGIRSVGQVEKKTLASLPHTLVGVAVCEPFFLQSACEKLRNLSPLRIITSYDEGIAREFAHLIGLSIDGDLDGRLLPNLSEVWMQAIQKTNLYYNIRNLDRLHISNSLKENFELKNIVS